MVLTRSMCKSCASIHGGPNTRSRAGNSNHDTNTVVYRDAARVAVDNHASARSRRTKSISALKPQIPTEDKLTRTSSRAAVPEPTIAKRPSGRKSSRGTRPRKGHQTIKQGRGSKSSINLAGPSGKYLSLSPGHTLIGDCYLIHFDTTIASTSLLSLIIVEPIARGPEGQNRARSSGKAGTKRSRETDDDAPESEAAPRANARRVRRRVDGPADRSERCNAIIPEIPLANEHDAGSSCQIPRRSARLASKSSNAIPRGQCSSTDNVHRVVGWRAQTRRKRTRTREHCEDAPEASNSRRIRRRTQEAVGPSNSESEGRTSGSDTKAESSEGTLVESRADPSNADRPERVEERSSPVHSIKNEDVGQDWLLVIVHERHPSVDSVMSAYLKNRESTEPRSSSVESLPTPPPPCMEEEEQVLLHQDFDAMIPLDSIPDENEREALNQAYLRQLQDHRPDDEADVEAEMADNRNRSLAPEPDQGLVDAIRSGRMSGLASPERLMHED
ncbi:hypothetical protein ACEPAI_1497 [Sanghuangporus weigelae]